jgi:type II secretion system protein C
MNVRSLAAILVTAVLVTPTGLLRLVSLGPHSAALAAAAAAGRQGDERTAASSDHTGGEPDSAPVSGLYPADQLNSDAVIGPVESAADSAGEPDTGNDPTADYPPETATEDAPPVELTTTRPYTSNAQVRLMLIGTAVAGDPALSMAIIEIEGTRRQEFFREGQWVRGVRIRRILRNRVIVDSGEKETTVAMLQSLPEENQARGDAFAPAVDRGGVDSAAPIRPDSYRPSLAARAAGRETVVHLDRNAAAVSLSDVDQATGQANVEPVMVYGRPAGVRVSPVLPGSIFAQLGLRSGDVIVGVNGESIDRPEQTMLLFQKIREGGDVAIQVKSRRRNRIIRLNIG